jgi:hypothetical protein
MAWRAIFGGGKKSAEAPSVSSAPSSAPSSSGNSLEGVRTVLAGSSAPFAPGAAGASGELRALSEPLSDALGGAAGPDAALSAGTPGGLSLPTINLPDGYAVSVVSMSGASPAGDRDRSGAPGQLQGAARGSAIRGEHGSSTVTLLCLPTAQELVPNYTAAAAGQPQVAVAVAQQLLHFATQQATLLTQAGHRGAPGTTSGPACTVLRCGDWRHGLT